LQGNGDERMKLIDGNR